MPRGEAMFKAGLFLEASGIGTFNKQLRKIRQQTQQADESVQQFTSSVGRMGDQLVSAGRGMAVAGAALLAPAVGAVRTALSLEKELTKVRSTQAFTEAQLNALRQESIAFQREHLGTSEEFVDVTYRMVSAGLDQQTALGGTRQAMRLATATMGDQAETGELLATVYNNLGDQAQAPAQEFRRISDVLTATQQAFQLRDLGQLQASFEDGATAAKAYGVSLEQTSLFLGALNTAGLTGTRAGTAFNATLRQMTKASRELGFEVERTESGQVDLVGTLANIEERFGKLSELTPEVQERFQKAFGDEGLRLVALLSGEAGKLAADLEEIRRAQEGIGATETAAQVFEGDPSARITLFMQNLRAFGQTYGHMFLEPIAKGADLATRMIQKLGAFADAHPRLAKAVAFGTTALGGLLLVGGGVVTALGLGLKALSSSIEGYREFGRNLKAARGAYLRLVVRARQYAVSQGVASAANLQGASSFRVLLASTRAYIASQYQSLTATWANVGGLRGLAAAAGGQIVKAMKAAVTATRAFTVSLLTNPVTLIAGAIGVAAVLIIKHWTPIKAFFQNLWKDVKPTLQPLLDFFSALWKKAQTLWQKIRPPLEKLWGLLKPIVGAVKSGLGTVAGWLGFGGAETGPAPQVKQAQELAAELSAARKDLALQGQTQQAHELVRATAELKKAGLQAQAHPDSESASGALSDQLARAQQLLGQPQQGARFALPQQAPTSPAMPPPPQQGPAARPPISVTINDRRRITVAGTPGADDVQAAAIASNEDLEVRVRRVLREIYREEQRTTF